MSVKENGEETQREERLRKFMWGLAIGSLGIVIVITLTSEFYVRLIEAIILFSMVIGYALARRKRNNLTK